MRMYLLFFAVVVSVVWSPTARAQSPSAAVDDRSSADEVSPLTLQVALDEASNRNTRLIVLRRQYEAMQYRPEQALALPPPSFEAQIWQWPINTLNAGNTNMYMFTVAQSLPGFEKWSPSFGQLSGQIKVKSGFIDRAASGCDEVGQSPGLGVTPTLYASSGVRSPSDECGRRLL